MGRRATVLSIWTGENDPTGLPEPLGLFLDKKNGQFFFFCPPGPPAGGQPFRAGYTGTPDVGKKRPKLTTSTKDTSPMFIPKVAI